MMMWGRVFSVIFAIASRFSRSCPLKVPGMSSPAVFISSGAVSLKWFSQTWGDSDSFDSGSRRFSLSELLDRVRVPYIGFSIW